MGSNIVNNLVSPYHISILPEIDLNDIFTDNYLKPPSNLNLNFSFSTIQNNLNILQRKNNIDYVNLIGIIEKDDLKLLENAEIETISIIDLSYNSLGPNLPIFLEYANKLQTIILQGNSLTNFQTTQNQLNSLTHLDLSSNNFNEIPSQIFQLINITTLNLFDNKIDKISEEITNLSSLTSLNISCNPLKQFPSHFISLSLKHLYFWGAEITSIPISLFRRDSTIRLSLQTLDLHCNQLETLPSSFCSMNQLTYLNLSYNSLIHFPFEINQLRYLRYLNISDNKLRILAPAISKLDLDYFYFANNQLQTPTLDDLSSFNNVLDYYEGLIPGLFFYSFLFFLSNFIIF